MKNRLKNTAKGAAIVGLVLASVASAQAQLALTSSYAQGDLIAGFTTGSGQDLIVNLGPESWLLNGQYWDISSLLNSAGISATSPSLQFGAVAVSANPNTVFATGSLIEGNTPNNFGGQSAFNQINTAVSGVGNQLTSGSWEPNVTASGTGSWHGENNGGNGTIFASLGNVNGDPGETTIQFFSEGQGATAPQNPLNTFTLQSNGALVYGTIPEPGTNAMFAAAGLLAFAFRNKLSRKQA